MAPSSLILVRHAQAGDAESFAATGLPDSLRPLTKKGRQRMREAAKGLRTMCEGNVVIYCSPYERARETADILAAEFATQVHGEFSLMTPEVSPKLMGAWLEEQPNQQETLLLVGHEPHLSGLAGWLLCGQAGSWLRFRKGGALKLQWLSGDGSGQVQMQWLLTQSQLRALTRTQ